MRHVCSPSKEEEGDLSEFPACAFFEVKKVVTNCCSSLKRIFPILFLLEGFCLVRSWALETPFLKRCQRCRHSTGAIYMLYLGYFSLLMIRWITTLFLTACGRNPWLSLECLCEVWLCSWLFFHGIKIRLFCRHAKVATCHVKCM